MPRLSLIAGLRDMIDGGRLTESMIPDDYAWLLEQLEALETYPLNSALEAH